MDLRQFCGRAAGVTFLAMLLAACQGGGANPTSFATGQTAPPGQLSVSPSSITFAGTGAAFAQTVTVTTTVAVAAASVTVDTSSCGTGATAIVSFAAPTGAGLTFSDVVTPLNPGTCSATVSSTAGGTATVTFTVNSGSVSVSGHDR
jgi:hypothetical protein